jgi:hypothetical protein
MRPASRLGGIPGRLAAALVLFVAACQAEPGPTSLGGPDGSGADLSRLCAFTTDAVFAGGVGRGGIPELVNPEFVPISHPDAGYADDYAANGGVEARVVGLMVDGTPVAIPHNILWWHEIVNLDLGGRRLAVTYCPLTGSAMVFDATAVGVARFGVSGLLLHNNLVMFDEATGSLWSQMCALAGDGDREGTRLVQVPAVEMRWAAWKARYPTSLVVSGDTGHDRDYRQNPYELYELNDLLLFPLPDSLDVRRPMKERVLGVPDGAGGIAFPFGELAGSAATTVVQTEVGDTIVQVLWDEDAGAAMAFHRRTESGREAVLRPDGLGFVDAGGTTWNLAGRAVAGPLQGERLVPVEGAFVAFWFAWSAFHPLTRIWTSE